MILESTIILIFIHVTYIECTLNYYLYSKKNMCTMLEFLYACVYGVFLLCDIYLNTKIKT